MTDSPVGMPFLFHRRHVGFGDAALLHSSMNAARAGFDSAACAAIGCSGATAQNVTPMMVSARVVNTYMRPSPIGLPSAPRMSWVKAKRTPSLFPIQFSCMMRTRSGQPGKLVADGLEQFRRVPGDGEVVAGDFALLDQGAGAPAAPVDHLFVGEHGLVDRVPVDDLGLPVSDALFQHLEEQPLVPFVVLGLAGRSLRATSRSPDPSPAFAASCRRCCRRSTRPAARCS